MGLVLLMAEILHQFIGSLSHYLLGFSTIPGGCLGFQPSTVGRLLEGTAITLSSPALDFHGFLLQKCCWKPEENCKVCKWVALPKCEVSQTT